jgi:hypothetical protein
MSPRPDRPRFLVLSLPRCGSTTLARALNLHDDLSCLMEPFDPGHYRGAFHAFATHASIPATLEVIWTRWNGIKHVWQSNGWPFVGEPEATDEIAWAAGAGVILIERRNLLRRAVSHYIGRQTQFWHGTKKDFERHTRKIKLQPLDPEAVVDQMQQDRESLWERIDSLRCHGIPFLHLCYEELFDEARSVSERRQSVNSVLQFLGCTPVSPQVFAQDWQRFFDASLYRLSSADVYRRIPGIDAIEARAGSDDTGWLFK